MAHKGDRPPDMETRPATGLALVSLAAIIWGAAYPLTKGALAHVPPLTLGFLRFALAGLVLMGFTRSLPLGDIAPEDRRVMVKLGFWGTFVLIVGMNLGLRWAPGMAASIISGTPPLFTVFLAAAWLSERILPRHLLALGTAFVGLILLGGDETLTGAGGWRVWAGCALVVVPQIAWAIYGVLGKAVSSRYAWPVVCRDTFTLGALMLAPVALIEGWWHGGWGLSAWPPAAWGVLAYLGIANSVITYGLWNHALSMIPVSTASFALYVQPLSGAIISAIMFGERLGWAGWVGALLIVAALAIVLLPHGDPALPGPENKVEAENGTLRD
jgi:drug/metabolite transporter (DMT)-like permease